MSRVMDEMLKFFDAVSGGSGPYGWIYAAEYERYRIENAEHETHDIFGAILEYLNLIIYGKYVVICYNRNKKDEKKFTINSLHHRTLYCKTLDELFNLLLSTYGN